MQISVGRTVHYKLSGDDCNRIQAQRAIRVVVVPGNLAVHLSAGNDPKPGDVVPLIVTATSPWIQDSGVAHPTRRHVNGQLKLDGNDVLWVTSVEEGNDFGQWQWPARES